MADTYTLESLLNTTDGMDVIVDEVSKNTTLDIEGVDWLICAGSTVDKVYIGTSHTVRLGSGSMYLRVLNHSYGQIEKVYRQEGSLDEGIKFLKIRVEGHSSLYSTDYRHPAYYELFLFDDGNILLYMLKSPTSIYSSTTRSVTDGKKTIKLDSYITAGITEDSAKPILLSNAYIDLTVAEKLYTPIVETGIKVTNSSVENYIGYQPDLTGMLIEAYDSSENTNTVSNFLLPDFDITTLGTQEYEITYKSYTAKFSVNYIEDTVTKINSVDARNHYKVGETMSDMTLYVTRKSGKYESVSSGFEITGFDSSTTGTKELTITCGETTYQYSVYISETSELIIDETTVTQYCIGDSFSSPTLYILYDDGYKEHIYNAECTGFDGTVAGDCVITVTVRDLTATYTVNVSDTLTVNIGSDTETDVTASLNLISGTLTISGTGSTKEIYEPYRGEGGLFNDGGEKYSQKVTSLIVEEGITALNGACFYRMINLKEITLPESLLTLGNGCFEYCSSLQTLVLPENLRTIGQNCFEWCYSLGDVVIPESVVQLGNFSFYNSSELDSTITILNRYVTITNTNSNSSTLRFKKIKGYVASTAEEYAEKYSVEFEALNKIASISIKTEPNKKEYWTLSAINTSGLILQVTDEDGVSVEVTSGFEIEMPDMTTAGEKNVTVKYKDFTCTYKITVTAPSFENIFNNVNGMTSNKSTINIPWFMFDGETCDSVTCSTTGYISFNGTKKIDVMRNQLNNSGDKYSASNIYSLETILDNGVRVAKIRCAGSFSGNYRKGTFPFEIFFFGTGDIYVYITGRTQALTTTWKGTFVSGGKTYSINGTPATAANKNTEAQTSCYHQDGTGLTWQMKSEAYSFPDLPQKLKITTLPDKIDYFTNDAFDASGLVATLVYSDGKEEVSEEYTVNLPDMSSLGIKDVTVTDASTGMTSEPFNIYVNIKKNIGDPTETDVQGITDIRNGILTISGTGATADYGVLESVFGGTYKYLNKIKIEPGITALGDSVLVAIPKGVTVSGLENIKVFGAYSLFYSKIDGELSLQNVEQIGADAFAFTNLENVNIGKRIKSIGEYAFNSESITEISIGRLEDSVSGSPWGAKNATVTWSGILSSIEVTPPAKTEYIAGEEFDSTGIVVTAVYDNGETEVLTDYTISKFEKDTLGKQTITITYKEFTATFTVNVYGTTKNIRISHYPTKIYYKSGENLDTTGLVVMIIDSQGTERETTNYNVSNLDTTVLGEQTITVSYQEAKGENLEQAWFDDFQVYVTKDATNPFMKANADIKITVHWPNGEFKNLTNKDIVKKSMKLKESICNERYFIWGGCISNCLTFQTGSSQFWDSGDEYVPRGDIVVYIECEGVKQRIFTGTIDSAKRTQGLLTRIITAYDPLYKFKNVDIAWWYKNQTTDKQAFLTQKQFRDLLFKYIGIEQEEVTLQYDDTYVPNTWTTGEMKVVDILQDLCLQNSVFGWMNRNGKFRYLTVKPNARVSGTSKDGVKSYEYYDSSVHYDVIADENTEITEGRIWYPAEFLPDPYPGLFSPGDITAQDAYEQNIYYIRDSFFIGNEDWIDYNFDADEYGALRRTTPLMKICYGTPTQIDSQHLYMAQGYRVKVRGNPLTRIGSKIQLQIRKRTPALPEYPEGKYITWLINSYIMSRTMEITGRGIMETYSAENGPYNSNKSQEGKHTQTYKAENHTTRSRLPTIIYNTFSDGDSTGKVQSYLKCIKGIERDDFDSLPSSQRRGDTVFAVFKEG